MWKPGWIAAGLVGCVLAGATDAMPTEAFTPQPATSGQVGGTPAEAGAPTTRFFVCGAVTSPMTETLSVLQRLPPHTETVTYMAGTKAVTDTYTGALLWDVLGSAGVLTDHAIKNDVLRKLVIAAGSDGYQVVFSLGELSPKFGDEPILVAYSDTMGQLAGADGFARLVVPHDRAGGRYVSNLASLSVLDPTVAPKASEHRSTAGRPCPDRAAATLPCCH